MRKSLPFVFLLMLTACLLLAGCSRQGDAMPSEAPSPTTAAGPQYGYILRRDFLPAGLALSTSQCSDGQSIYICGMDAQAAPCLGRLTGQTYSPFTLPEDIEFVYACSLSGQKLIVLAGDYPEYYRSPFGDIRNEAFLYQKCILIYDCSGQLSTRISVCDELNGGESYFAVCRAGDYFYLMTRVSLYQLTDTGVLVNSMHLEGGQFFSQTVKEDVLSICFFDSSADGGDDTVKISLMTSPETLTFRPVHADGEGFLYGFCGFGYAADGRLLLASGKQVSALDTDSGEQTLLYDFNDNGMTPPAALNVFSMDDGWFLSERYTEQLCRLVYGEISPRTELTLWLFGGDSNIDKLVEDFNQSDPDYKIKVVAGSEFLDYTEQQLQMLIVSGKGPDLYQIGTGHEPGKYWHFPGISGKAVFEDLLPWLEERTALGQDNFYPAVLASAMEGEGLYYLPLDFTVNTLLRRTDLLPGDSPGLMDALELPQVKAGDAQPICNYYDRSLCLYWLGNLYLGSHVDRASAGCGFDTPEYADILRFCLTRPEGEVTPIAGMDSVYEFGTIPGSLRLLYLQKTFGSHLSLFNSDTTAVDIGQGFAMSNTSPNKEGVWRFMEFVLASDLADARFSWPAGREQLDRLIREAQTRGVWDEETHQYIKLEDGMTGPFMAFLSAPENARPWDGYPELLEICTQEAQKFLAGDKSLEDTIAVTQSRANIYLAEKFG